MMLVATVLLGNAQIVAVGNVAANFPGGNFPRPTGAAYAVEADTLTNTVYFGGNFSQFGDSVRNLFASVDMKTYMVNPLKVTFTGSYGTNRAIWAIAQNDTAVFVAGDFLTVNGEDRKCLAAFNKQTGALSPFRVDVITNGIFPSEVVRTLKLDGNILYVGGLFDTIGGVARKNLAAIDLTTSTVTSWNPQPNNTVYSLEVNNDYVFAGGMFTDIGGLVKQNFAALTKGATANAVAGIPVALGGQVFAIKFHEGAVYIGGFFNQVGTSTRWRLAKIDISGSTGTVSSWHPLAHVATDPQVNTYRVQSIEAKGTSIFAAGQFRTLVNRINSAEFHSVTGEENTIEVMGLGLVYANKLVNNHLIVSAFSFDFRVMRSFDTIPRSSCGSYGFEDGTEVFTSGVYPVPAVDFFYRDTFIDLNITIKPNPSDSVTQVYNSLVVQEDSASYTWFAGCTLCGGKIDYTSNAGRNGCAEYIGDFTTNTFTPDSSGEYLVIISKNGCDAFVCTNFVQCSVDTSISIVGDSLVAGASNATAYEWINCNTNTATGATSRSFKPTATGSYGVRVTDPACGVVTTRCIDVVISSVSNISGNPRVVLYPNPASSEITIATGVESALVNIYALDGRLVISTNATSNLHHINISTLAQGSYVAEVKGEATSRIRFEVTR